MEYTVVTAREKGLFNFNPNPDAVRDEFLGRVNQMIIQGWKPLGGVSVISDASLNYQQFSQAMIKK